MNYGPRYQTFIKETKRIPRNLIEVNEVYRLVSYEYANGETESISGQRATLIFVFGIYKRVVHALKLNVINPELFFRWLKRASSRRVTELMLQESDLPSLLKTSEETGRAFFSSRIKGNSVYKIEPRAYRTYKFFNIKDIQRVNFKQSKLEEIFGTPNLPEAEKQTADKKIIKKQSTDAIEQKGIETDKKSALKTVEKAAEKVTPSVEEFVQATIDILNKKEK